MQRILVFIASTMALIAIVGLHATASAQSLQAVAAASSSKSLACDGLKEVDSSQTCDSSTDGIDSIARAVIRIISFLAGTVAVIMVILAGFRYITSGGDSGKVGSAKSTLIYALVGVAILALSQGLIHFVLNTSSNVTTPCSHVVKDDKGHKIKGLTEADAQCK